MFSPAGMEFFPPPSEKLVLHPLLLLLLLLPEKKETPKEQLALKPTRAQTLDFWERTQKVYIVQIICFYLLKNQNVYLKKKFQSTISCVLSLLCCCR